MPSKWFAGTKVVIPASVAVFESSSDTLSSCNSVVMLQVQKLAGERQTQGTNLTYPQNLRSYRLAGEMQKKYGIYPCDPSGDPAVMELKTL
jgi:hypothetical protein